MKKGARRLDLRAPRYLGCLKAGRESLAAAPRDKIDQTTEQAGAEAVDMHRAARVAGLASHLREHIRRKIDTKFAAHRCVVTHLVWTPFLFDRVGKQRIRSVLGHMAGMMCRDSHCFQCRKTRTSLCSCLIGV